MLQQEQENAQRENFEVTEYLRREILGKDEKIAILEAQVDQVSTPTPTPLPETLCKEAETTALALLA